MNYARFLTAVSSARRPSPIRQLTAILQRSPPSMISLAGGLPNPELFPFESAVVKLRNGSTINLDATKMKRALQYGPSTGMTELVDWLKEFQRDTHSPPTYDRAPETGGMDLCLTCGIQEGLGKTIDMLVNPGDNVLIESPTFSGTIDGFTPKGCHLLPVETDADGMIPAALRRVLASRWTPSDAQNPASDVPRLLYTIPNGVNPTGTSLTAERRREIYQIAREYDLLIMEDDPYYFIQFTEPRPSFLSLDEDGRVLRFDSFSKVLSAGLRLGFMSGPTPLVQKIVQHIMVSSMHPSMISQVMAYEFLSSIGISGFREHTNSVATFYQTQRDHMLKSVHKWLTGKAEWTEPKAGMFLWMKLQGVADTERLIMEKALAKEVLFVPGKSFMPGARDQPCPYVRASFSIASPQNIDTGIQRLASVIEEEWKESGYSPPK